VVARFRFSLGRLNDPVLVLGRSVDRVETQRLTAGIADIVASTRRYDHRDIVLDLILAAVDVDRAFAFVNAEELVAVGMQFLADFLARLQSHQHQLQVLAGVQDPAEVLICLSQILDIVAKAALHCLPPLSPNKIEP
jgi:hypothetical protein